MTETSTRQRMRFRSWHRGTREMDLLMGSFADAHLHNFTAEQLDQYDSILQHNDPDLYNWIAGVQPLPVECNGEVMRLLVRHRFAVA